MPAPRRHHRDHEAKAGRSSGAASAVRRIWPTMTPISAPRMVAAIAASERKRSVRSTIAMATPMSSPTGASCSEARSMRMPRSRPGRRRRAWSPRRRRRLAVLLLEVGGIGRVADVDRGDAPSCEIWASSPNGSPTDSTPSILPTVARAPSIAGLCPRACPGDAEDDRRVRAGERGPVCTEEVERLLGLRPRDLEVVRRLATGAGGRAEQHEHDEGRCEASQPVVGERARYAREQQGQAQTSGSGTTNGERPEPTRSRSDRQCGQPNQATGLRRARCPEVTQRRLPADPAAAGREPPAGDERRVAQERHPRWSRATPRGAERSVAPSTSSPAARAPATSASSSGPVASSSTASRNRASASRSGRQKPYPRTARAPRAPRSTNAPASSPTRRCASCRATCRGRSAGRGAGGRA